MSAYEKIYKRVEKAVDTYTTPSNAPIMEAVKEMGKVYFCEAIIDHSKPCPYCDGTGESNYAWGPDGKLSLRLPNGLKLPCPACNGEKYLPATDPKGDILNPENENPEDKDIFDQLNAAEFGGARLVHDDRRPRPGQPLVGLITHQRLNEKRTPRRRGVFWFYGQVFRPAKHHSWASFGV